MRRMTMNTGGEKGGFWLGKEHSSMDFGFMEDLWKIYGGF